MNTLTLRARWVLVSAGDDHRLLIDGEVRIVDDRIVAVGPASDEACGEVLELGDAILMPGLIDLDALADIDHAILDSWHDPAAARRLQWSERHARRTDRVPVLDAAQRAVMRRFAFAQLLLHGVTCAMPIASEVHSDWAETFDDAVQMVEAAEDLGIRVVLGPSYRSGVPVAGSDGSLRIHWEPARGEAGFADAVRFLRWVAERRSPLASGALLPCRVETMTDDLLARTAEAAEEFDVPVRLHALQGLEELRLLRERGTTSLDLIEQAGMLTDRLLIPHAIYVDENPRAGTVGGGSFHRIADAGATIVHCPLTSARYGAALDHVDRYREAGVAIALGTDSFPPDLIRGIDVGSSVAKILAGRLDAGAHAHYIRAATLGGAQALRRNDLGRIAVGATADLVAFRLDDVRDGVIDDPIRTLVQHSTGRALTLSIVGGVVRVRDGELVGTDMAELRAQAQSIFALLKRGYGERTDVPVSTDELFPPSFPTA